MAFDVFISHAHVDKKIAEAVCHALETNNIRCWIAPRDVDPGKKFEEEILNAITHARIMLLVFSSNANSSEHVGREVVQALNHRKLLVPFRIEDSKPEGQLAYYLGSIQWLDALPPFGQEHLDDLVNKVRIYLAPRKQAEVAPVKETLRQDHLSQRKQDLPIIAAESKCNNAPVSGIVTGNGVSLRQRPTVAAKVIQELDQGEEILVLDKITVSNDGECQLKDDVIFKPEDGGSYRLRAGKGLLVSGERDDLYRIEIRRKKGIDVGYIPKSAVVLLGSASWCNVRFGDIEGWVYSRYIRTF